ncbi:hypothetical protein [Salinigranum sp. GCM10025319]|uniref:hypothetical protein n=1 Tax=Salinigranum sp. GCM10025319 TaxID=3252687 RepID=UPI003609AA9F
MTDLPSRREFLAGGVAAVLTATTGCLEDAGGFGSDDAGRSLRLTLTREDGPLRESFVVDLAETRPEWDEEAFAAALAGDDYTIQYRKPFFSTPEDPVYTRNEGTYYRLGSVVVDEATVTRPVLRLFEIDRGADSSEPDGVDAAELPTGDERAVRVAHFAARARGNEGGAPWGLVQRGGYVYRDEDAVDESVLLADSSTPDHVVYRDRVYSVEVSRERFHEPVYRATVEPVAETPERMEAILRAQFVDARFSREDLSPAAREVVRAARREGYAERHPYSTGYREVLRALHRRAYIDGNIRKDAGVDDEGRRMLRYNGVYYDYRLRFLSTDS